MQLRASTPIVTLGLLVAACAAGGGFWRASTLQPHFNSASDTPVIEQRHTTGTVAPAYFHADVVTVTGTGAWTAVRTYPYTDPPRTETIGSGSISVAKVQELVDLAFATQSMGETRFVDLPGQVNATMPGAGTTQITLWLEGGSQSVSVIGSKPPTFARLDSAIASATVPLSI